MIKSVLAGADVVQLVSALIEHGPSRMSVIRQEMEAWMSKHKIESLDSIRGLMSARRVLDPAHFDRMNYIGVLHDAAMASLAENK